MEARGRGKSKSKSEKTWIKSPFPESNADAEMCSYRNQKIDKASKEWQGRFLMVMYICVAKQNLPAGEMRRRANEEGNEQRPPEKVGPGGPEKRRKETNLHNKRERKRKHEEI